MIHRCFFVHGPTSRPSHSIYRSTEAAIAGGLNEAAKEAPIGNVQIVPYGAGLYVYYTQQEAKDIPKIEWKDDEPSIIPRARVTRVVDQERTIAR